MGQLAAEQLASLGRGLGIGFRGGVGVDGDARLGELDLGESLLKGLLRRGDQGAVERGGDGELAVPNRLFLEQSGGTVNFPGGSREHGLVRRIAVGDDEFEFGFLDELLDLLAGSLDGQHGAAVGLAVAPGFGHQAAAEIGEAMEGGGFENAGGAERNEFAVAVSGRRRGFDIEGLDYLEGPETDGADRGLRDVRGGQFVALPLGSGLVEGRVRVDEIAEAAIGVPLLGEDLVGLGQGVLHLRELTSEVAQHVRILGALTGKENAEVAVGFAGAEDRSLGKLPVGVVRILGKHRLTTGEKLGEIGPVALDDQDQAAFPAAVELAAALGGGGPEFSPGKVRFLGCDGLPESIQRVGGKREELNGAVPIGLGLVVAVFLQQAVEVAAAEAEGTDPGAAGMGVIADPGAFARIDVERVVVRFGGLDGLVDLDGWGERLVVQRQSRLDQAGGAGGGLRVADLGFDRTERAPGAAFPGFAIDFLQCVDLHGVADSGARAVRLNHFDGVGRDGGLFIGALDGLFLAAGLRGVDGVAGSVAGGAQSADDRVDLVVVAFCVGEAFQHDHSDALAQNGAVGVVGKGLRIAALGQGGRLAEAHVHEDVVEGVHTAGDDHVGTAGVEFQTGEMNGAERAGAGGVDDAVGAAEVEAVGDAAGGDIAEQAGEGVFLPGNVGLGNALDDVVGGFGIDPGLIERAFPDRVAESGAERDDEFEGAGDAENDAGAVAVEFPGSLARVAGVGERLLGGDES